MWLNAKLEKSWGELFKYENKDKVVILNPGKRKRYTEHEGDIARESISVTLDSISGGDARFNRVSELPTFEIRTDWFAHTYLTNESVLVLLSFFVFYILHNSQNWYLWMTSNF